MRIDVFCVLNRQITLPLPKWFNTVVVKTGMSSDWRAVFNQSQCRCDPSCYKRCPVTSHLGDGFLSCCADDILYEPSVFLAFLWTIYVFIAAT